MLGRRPAKWPIITNNAGIRERGTIKRTSVQDILRLGEEAARNEWGGQGRPAWLTENAEQIEDIYVTLRNPKRDRMKCYVMVMFADGPAGSFTIDMTRSAFESLADLTQEELVTLAHRYFRSFPSVSLDPEQQAAWDHWTGRQGEESG